MKAEEQTFRNIILATILTYLVGLMLLSIALGDRAPIGAIGFFAATILIGAGIAVAGGLLGFIFGMPKSFLSEAAEQNRKDTSSSLTEGAPESAKATQSRPSASVDEMAPKRQSEMSWANNNLVEVSDWLTKIVVGVGLVQLTEIVKWVRDTGEMIGHGVGLESPLESLRMSFGVTIILVNFGLGFLVTYIYARTFLTILFASVFKQINEGLERTVSEISESTEEIRSVVLEVAKGTGGPSAVLAKLYQPQPKGFRKAIELADSLLSDPDHADDPNLWGYLACGLGQQHGYDMKQGRPEEGLRETADRAYEAVKKTLQLDPSKKGWLRALWDRDAPSYDENEGDLVSLWDDPSQKERFAELLR